MAKITLDEQASPGTPGAGKGTVYVKNDAPSTLFFIDDVGTEAQLGLGAVVEFDDDVFRIRDQGDNTKKLAFEISANTTGIVGTLATGFTTAKTLTLPDATDTLVGRDTTDTLTSKTLTTPTIGDFSNAGHDHSNAAGGGTLANNIITNVILADVKEYSLKGKATAGTGDPSDLDETDVTTDATPISGDFLLGWLSTGELRKYDVGTLPSAGANTLDAAYDEGGAAAGRSIQINALTGAAVRLHHNAAGVIEALELESNPSVGAAQDEIRILSRHADTSGAVVETGSIAFIGIDATIGSQNSEVALRTLVNGTLAESFRLSDIGDLSFGRPTDENRQLTFNRSTNDGTIIYDAVAFVFNRIVDATTGFRVGSAATVNNYLRGDGNDFIDAPLSIVDDTSPQLGGHLDINGQVIGDGTRELLTFVEDGAAINHIEIENQAAGNGPFIRAVGDDTDIDLHLVSKGTGNIKLDDDSDVTGDFTVSGLLNGRDYDADGTKLDGIEALADVTDTANVQAAHPIQDSVSIVEDPSDATKELRLDVGGNTTGIVGVLATVFTTAKTLTLPDATDTLVGRDTTDTLTAKTLTTPTIGDFSNAGHDHSNAAGGGTLANNIITNVILADVKEYSLKGKATAATGDPNDLDELDVTTEGSPASGDFLLGWLDTGELRKFDVGTLPSAGANTLDAAYDEGGAAAGRSIQINALTGTAVRLHHNATGIIEMLHWESNPAAGAASDEVRVIAGFADTAGTVVTTGLLRFVQTDATIGSQDSKFVLNTTANGALADTFTLNNAGNLTIGRSTDEARSITFNRSSTDGVLTFDGTTFDFDAIVDATTGFRIAGAAASAEYLRGDSTNFISTALAIVDDPSPQLAADLDMNAASRSFTNGAEQILTLVDVASALNEITITNAAAGNGPIISSTGEANTAINIQPAGTGQLAVNSQTEVNSPSGDARTALNLIQGATGAAAGAHVNVDDKAGDPPSPNTGDIWRNGDALNFRQAAATVDLTTGTGSTLDQAYDQGGAAAGRSIQINALTGAAVRLHHNAAGVVEAFELESNPAVGAASDEMRILSRHADTAGTVVETGRLAFIQTDATIGSQNSNIALDTLVDGTLAESFLLTDVGNLSFGRPTDENRVLTFNRSGTDGLITFDGTTFDFDAIVDATTGFRIAGAAATGEFLKGNGTNFISAGIALDSDTISGTLAVAQGGTNLASGTDGGLLYFDGTTSIASSALLALNQVVLGGGAAAAPATLAAGTAFQHLRQNSGATAAEWATDTKSKAILVEDPANGDRLAMWMNEAAITILGVSFSSLAGTSVLFNVEFATTIASGTVIHTDTCATSTPEWDVTPSGTAAVPTDRIILLEITTVTGSVTDFNVTVHYRENA